METLRYSITEDDHKKALTSEYYENPDEEISIPVQENVIQESPIDNFNRALDRTAFADLAFDNPTPTESFEPEETFADDENQDGLGFDIF